SPPDQRPPASSADPISDRREVILGNLIHDWLRRLGERPLPEDADAWAVAQRPAWERQLRTAGLADADLDAGLNEAARQLTGVLADETGRWLLAPHEGAASEYGVTGMLDGVLTSAFFDRTFETDGVRWIIDYKTGRADDEASAAARYRPQLARYRSLAEGLFDAPIKTALYLTAIARLVEL
ncbi:MAG: PD-(D/E)XK nuclease family protein, partial [Gammaproteobacteria bacterium]|nr:PD-(D/E)XK nuclease family protein [Gammaproteobacteria bacterium]